MVSSVVGLAIGWKLLKTNKEEECNNLLMVSLIEEQAVAAPLLVHHNTHG